MSVSADAPFSQHASRRLNVPRSTRTSQSRTSRSSASKAAATKKPHDAAAKDIYSTAALIRVALPLVVAVACFSFNLFADRTLLMWFDPGASAASMAAGNLYWTVACVPVTAMSFITPLIAAAAVRTRPDERSQNGGGTSAVVERDRRRRAIASLVWQCVWVTAATTPLFALAAVAAEPFFLWSGHAAELAADEAIYFRILLLVAPASMLEAGLAAFLIGRRITRPIMKLNLATAVFNLLLDVVLIFGVAAIDVPAMGIRGAALATAAAAWIKVAMLATYLLMTPSFRRVAGRCWRPNLRRAGEIMLPGSTLGIQQLVRSAAYSFMLVQLGVVSVGALAASTAALSLYQFFAIPMIGLATAVTVLCGQATKQHGRPLAVRTMGRGFMLAGVYIGVLASAMVITPGVMVDFVLGADFVSGDPSSGSVRQMAVSMMRLAAVYALLDVTLLILSAGLKGMGRTLVLLLSTCIATALGLVIATGIGDDVRSNWWFWWSLLVGWTTVQVAILAVPAIGILIGSRSAFRESGGRSIEPTSAA